MADAKGDAIDAIMVSESDNVASCLRDIREGATITIMLGKDRRQVVATEPIPRGHKIAVRDIGPHDRILKYGEVIGRASGRIRVGEHVHIHNIDD